VLAKMLALFYCSIGFIYFFTYNISMKAGNYINPLYKLSQIDSTTVPRRISFSQWSIYEKCPKQWELSYIKKLAPFNHSIEMTFGTAFHETMQEFLTVMYTKSVTAASRLDLPAMLKDKMKSEYMKAVAERGGEHFSTPRELEEYLSDGIAILNWFSKRRSQYFSTKQWELIGIEVELCTPASELNESVYWYGFLDIVIKDVQDNKIIIFDIKTSRTGWNKHQKADKIKTGQLVAYKNYYSKQFGTPADNIDVEFFIVKRKIQEDSMFPQKRIQQFRPASGKVTQRQIQRQIDNFISECFDGEGNKNENREYAALAGRGAKNCKYCPFKEDYVNCPKENRIRS